jgi:malate dehydrogenase
MVLPWFYPWFYGSIDHFIPGIQRCGAAIIEARGLSSAASAADAVVDHVHDRVLGARDGDWVSKYLN